jgi:hypothetical protein
MKFTKDTKTATVSRLSTTTSWWYKKSWYASTWKSYQWHLKALTIKQVVDINNFGKEFEFHTEFWADILESDKLTIDTITYDVKWLSKFDWITFSRLICVLQKW